MSTASSTTVIAEAASWPANMPTVEQELMAKFRTVAQRAFRKCDEKRLAPSSIKAEMPIQGDVVWAKQDVHMFIVGALPDGLVTIMNASHMQKSYLFEDDSPLYAPKPKKSKDSKMESTTKLPPCSASVAATDSSTQINAVGHFRVAVPSSALAGPAPTSSSRRDQPTQQSRGSSAKVPNLPISNSSGNKSTHCFVSIVDDVVAQYYISDLNAARFSIDRTHGVRYLLPLPSSGTAAAAAATTAAIKPPTATATTTGKAAPLQQSAALWSKSWIRFNDTGDRVAILLRCSAACPIQSSALAIVSLTHSPPAAHTPNSPPQHTSAAWLWGLTTTSPSSAPLVSRDVLDMWWIDELTVAIVDRRGVISCFRAATANSGGTGGCTVVPVPELNTTLPLMQQPITCVLGWRSLPAAGPAPQLTVCAVTNGRLLCTMTVTFHAAAASSRLRDRDGARILAKDGVLPSTSVAPSAAACVSDFDIQDVACMWFQQVPVVIAGLETGALLFYHANTLTLMHHEAFQRRCKDSAVCPLRLLAREIPPQVCVADGEVMCLLRAS